jgi:cyclic AMP-dependent transcription factor ATF-4
MMSFYDLPLANNNCNKIVYDFLLPAEAPGSYVQQPNQHQQIIPQHASKTFEKPTTDELLMEFDNVYDAVELNHLTPPQTPPRQYTPPVSAEQQEQQQIDEVLYTIFNGADSSQQQIVYQPQSQQPQQQQNFVFNQNFIQNVSSSLAEQEISIIFDNNIKIESAGIDQKADQAQEQHIQTQPIISSEIARELEVVDELVRSRSKNLPDWTDPDEDYSAISSSSYSPRSEESSSGFSQDDDDWAAASTSTSKKYRPETVKTRKSGIDAPLKGVTKARTRPYQRGAEDKKSRKKEQNKNAATRYRQKKKQEIEVILDEERVLHDEFQKLLTEYKDKKREMSYLRGLLKDLYQAKGLI